MTITDKKLKESIERRIKDGTTGDCPCCQSGAIEGGFCEVDEAYVNQKCHCIECGAVWTDSYRLESTLIIEQPDLLTKR